MTDSKLQYYAENMESAFRRDRLLLNNPVIMQGLGLAPLVVVCTSLRTSIMISIAILLLLTPTRILAALVSRLTMHRFKGVCYILSAAVIYAGVLFIMQLIYTPAQLLLVGIYLPLLVAEPLIIKRYERPQKERVATAFSKGLRTSFGFVLVAIIVGSLREFLATGALLEHTLVNFQLFPLAQLPSGGFIVLSIVMALWRGRVASFRKQVEEEVQTL